MEIYRSPLFHRQYKKLPPEIREAADKRVDMYIANPHDQRLRVHKLSGSLEGFSTFSITHSYRIMFSTEGEIVYLYQIGTHDIYD